MTSVTNILEFLLRSTGRTEIKVAFNDLIDSPLVFPPVLPVQLGSLLVDGRVQVRLREERLDVSQYLGHIMGRAPVSQRKAAVRSNVGVKHRTVELHRGRMEWIVWRKCQTELEHSKFHQVVGQTTDITVPSEDVNSSR